MSRSHLDVSSRAFANIHSDNRIHLFDLEAGVERQSLVERGHLSHTYTCSAWSKPAQAAKKNDSTTNSRYGLLAVGTSNSRIIIFDLDRGVVRSNIEVDGVPSDISFGDSVGNNVYYTVVGSPEVHRLGPGSKTLPSIRAGKRGFLKIAANPKADGSVACAK